MVTGGLRGCLPAPAAAPAAAAVTTTAALLAWLHCCCRVSREEAVAVKVDAGAAEVDMREAMEIIN